MKAKSLYSLLVKTIYQVSKTVVEDESRTQDFYGKQSIFIHNYVGSLY